MESFITLWILSRDIPLESTHRVLQNNGLIYYISSILVELYGEEDSILCKVDGGTRDRPSLVEPGTKKCGTGDRPTATLILCNIILP